MRSASPSVGPAPSRSSQEEADSREFADFIAGQPPCEAAAAGWVVRRKDGLTPEEEAEFQSWLATDPEHAGAFDEIEAVWGRLDELPDEDVEALRVGLPVGGADAAQRPSRHREARTAAAGSPGLPGVLPPRPMPLQSTGRRRWFARVGRLMPSTALAATTCGVVGGGWLGWRMWERQPTFTRSLATARGQQTKARLPDGSTVWLDTATRIEVVFYRRRREVRLIEGQALFSVQADGGLPFEVLSGALRTTVVGTRFAVRHTGSGLGQDGGVSVAVEEGRVRVARSSVPGADPQDGADVGTALELSAGQSVTADAAGGLARIEVDGADRVSWREGRVNFNGTPLVKALAEFERYGDTGLWIRDPAVAALRVQGSFSLRQVAAFARALPQVLPVRLRSAHGRTEIVALGTR